MKNRKTPRKKPRPEKKDPALDLVRIICGAIQEVKGRDIVILDMRKLSSYADYLVIASGTSTRQVAAIADRVRENVRLKLGKHPLGIEGTKNAVWVLVDHGDVVTHIFMEDTRAFYRLENLWHDAGRLKLKMSARKKAK